MATPRFNLRNASLYLTKLKSKYIKPNEQDNIYDNTFIDEEEQLTSSPSMKKISSRKIDSNTDRYESENMQEVKGKQQQQLRVTFQEQKQPITFQQQKQQTQFCDLIVIKYLQETLGIYKSDLQILQHNRQNLEQEIYFIGKKIGNLHQLAAQNVKMELEVKELNEQLKSTIELYHHSNNRVFKQKIALNKVFHKYQNKLKQFLLFNRKNQNDTQSYVKPNVLTSAYIDEYTIFLNFKQQQANQINNTLKNPTQAEKEKAKLVKTLFEGKQKIYFVQQKSKQREIPKSQQLIIPPEMKKENKVVLYDEFDNDQDAEVIDKTKDKPKKLSQAEKALLLGDLKNFSKSFKIPK